MSAYRAKRRAEGKDTPRPLRLVNTDRYIPRDWFRRNIWNPAIARSGIDLHVTPHGLCATPTPPGCWPARRHPGLQGPARARLDHHHAELPAHPARSRRVRLKAMDAIRGVRTATPVPGEAMLSAEQLAEYEALEQAKELGQAGQAVLEVGGEQMVISAEEYAEFEQLRGSAERVRPSRALCSVPGGCWPSTCPTWPAATPAVSPRSSPPAAAFTPRAAEAVFSNLPPATGACRAWSALTRSSVSGPLRDRAERSSALGP